MSSPPIKMPSVVPPSQKKTLNSRRTIDRDPKEINDKDPMFPLYFLIMIPNTIGAFTRAYRRNDYSMAVLGLLVLLSLALYDCCLPMYLSFPKKEKSSRKSWLKLIMWCLYTALSFGFVYEFGHLLSFQTTVALYAAVLVCSVFLLYQFVIVDLFKDWKSRNSGEQGIGLLENQRLGAGEVKDSGSVLEKV